MMPSHRFYGYVNVLKVAIILVLVISLANTQAESGQENQSGKTLRLSSLDTAKMSSGWGKPLVDRSVQDYPMAIAEQKFEHGIGTHANSLMYIDLNGGTKRFKAFVGVDDEMPTGKATVQFRVYGDGKKLWQSEVMKSGDKAAAVDVDLTGVKIFILSVSSTPDGIDFDHANWAQAEFLVTGALPKAIDRPADKTVILTPRPGSAPQINGPKVYGARPGNPFLYRIPVTGKRPISFSADNLPASLKLDTNTGIITGTTPNKQGEYIVTFKAANESGKAQRQFKIVAGDTLALTPPMGWNSWYIHYNRVAEADMRLAADAMISSGMADFGYEYVNIDDCWMVKPNSSDPMHGGEPRDAEGGIRPNAKFKDIKGMVDYIHSKGLKAGLYTSPGRLTCAGYVGSYEHEEIDALKFAEWGFDFLKYDWCSYGQIAKNQYLEELMKPYKIMGDILRQLNKDIVFNLCQYGMGDVWKWGGDVGGNCWRTTGDLGLSSLSEGIYRIGLSNARHYEYAQPGRWNDPDYILIGYVGDAFKMGQGQPTTLTANEQYAQMSMWCMMASPLIFSGDMTKLDEFTLNVLCNAEIIDVDQDPLGRQGKIITETDEYFVMLRDMEDGSKAIGLFNISEIEMPVAVEWAQLGIEGKYRVRDLWRQKDVGFFKDRFEISVPRHGAAVVRVFTKE